MLGKEFIQIKVIEFNFSESSTDNEKFRCEIITEGLSLAFQQITKIDQLLMMPLSFYYGFYISYYLADVIKAFVSCSMGVEKVSCFFFVIYLS